MKNILVAVKLATGRPQHLPVRVASSSTSHKILRVVVVIISKAKTELIVASDGCCLQDSFNKTGVKHLDFLNTSILLDNKPGVKHLAFT